MSRYRPPAAASTALITREGFERLREELNHLWKEKRPEVVKPCRPPQPKVIARKMPNTLIEKNSLAKLTGAFVISASGWKY